MLREREKPGGSLDRLVAVTQFTPATALAAFRSSLLRVFEALPQRCERIAIKINLCDYRAADSGATTHPELLEALIDTLRERYADVRVSVMENDAAAVEADSLFALLGFRELAQRKGIVLVNVAREPWVKKRVPGNRILEDLEIPAVLEEADLFINFAKLKTNALTKTTGCLKNLFGLLRVKNKSLYHAAIDDVLVDINRAIRPGLCLVDGYIGVEGRGPSFGRPKLCGLLITGVNPVSVDACCARIMGFNPWFVAHIRKCAFAGLGSPRYHLSTDIPDFRYSDYRFSYNRLEHYAKAFLRRRLGISA